MNRQEYLKQLERYLKKLPAADYQEAMDYFTEYFDEAGPEHEADVIKELGTPKEAAGEIISNILGDSINTSSSRKRSRKEIVWISILALFAAPIAIPMALALLTMILGLVLFILSMIGTAIMVLFALIFLGVFYIVDAFNLAQQVSLAAASLSFGGGLGSVGLGLLILLAIYELIRLSGRGIILLIHRFTKKGHLS